MDYQKKEKYKNEIQSTSSFSNFSSSFNDQTTSKNCVGKMYNSKNDHN